MLVSLIYVALGLIIALVGKKVIDMVTPYDDNYEIEEGSNLAVGFSKFGLYAGLLIAICGPVLANVSDSFSLDLVKWMVIEGVLVIVMFIISSFVTDKVILPGLNNSLEVEQGNVAVGIIEMSVFLATGLIGFASFSGGEGPTIAGPVFFLLGQVALVICAKLFELFTPFSIAEEIRGNNASAAVLVGGVLVSLSLILRSSISGEFVDWSSDLLGFGKYTLLGMALLLAVYKIVDWTFLPNTNMKTEIRRDKNTAASLLMCGVMVGVAILLSLAVV
ncbi:MAG: DUF350 domain-containing protein [Candidatus Pacebacteria bacterium]|nr:DUF350 domain-containing protein [Candidatus Paceibacterota bacterium]